MCSHFTYLFSRQDYTFYPPKSSNYGGYPNWINNFNIVLLYECKLTKKSAGGLSLNLGLQDMDFRIAWALTKLIRTFMGKKVLLILESGFFANFQYFIIPGIIVPSN